MKYIILLFLLMGCGKHSPSYKPGNCFQHDELEGTYAKIKSTTKFDDGLIKFNYVWVDKYHYDVKKTRYAIFFKLNYPKGVTCKFYEKAKQKALKHRKELKEESRLRTIESKIEKLEEFQKRVDDLDEVKGE